MTSVTRLQKVFLDHEADLVRFLAGRVGSPSLAADLAQDLYLKLDRTGEPPLIRNRRAYLFSMAANLARDHVRVERRRAELREEAGDVISEASDALTPERHMMGRAELACIEKEIAKLDARTRRVFYLSRFEGRTQEEIARELGIGVTTVYKSLKTAMTCLMLARKRFRGGSD